MCLVAGLAAGLAGCASHRFTRPDGPASPLSLPEARAAWREATAGCDELRAYNAEIDPSGRVGDGRIRGVDLLLAVDADGHLALQAEVAGPLFTLKGTAVDATLWLPRENRVVDAPPDAILQRLVGVGAGPSRLLALFAGCVAPDRAIDRADRVGELVRVATPDSVVYLERRDERWQVRAGEFDGVLVDYGDVEDGRPGRVALRTVDGRTPAVDLVLRVRAHVWNPDLSPVLFESRVPPTAVPAALDDLRPLGAD